MKKGFAFIVLAGVLWGLAGVFVKQLGAVGFSSLQMTAMRMFTAFLALALYCLAVKREVFRISWRALGLCVLSGAALFGTSASYFAAMQYTTISVAVVLMYLAPIPVLVFSVLFWQERLTVQKGIAIGLMLAGCVFVTGLVGNFKPSALGVLFGLLSAGSYALYNILTKYQVKNGVAPLSGTLYTFLFSSIFALVFCRPQEIPAILAQAPLSLGVTAALHGILTCTLPYLFYSLALKTLSVGTAVTFSIVEPMSATVISIVVYGEPITVWAVLGMGLILFATYLLGRAEMAKEGR